jgi:hypothetical protein
MHAPGFFLSPYDRAVSARWSHHGTVSAFRTPRDFRRPANAWRFVNGVWVWSRDMEELERFAARLEVEWRNDSRSGSCMTARWLDQFACLSPRREPDRCPDAVSRLSGAEYPIRLYCDGERVIAFRGDRECYDLPWRAIAAFLLGSLSGNDDELPQEPAALPLVG